MGTYSVIRADLKADRKTIVDLWSRNLLAHSPEEHQARYGWHYLDNPIGPGRVYLVRHDPSGEVVGTAGLGLRKVSIDGESVTAGIAVDFAVDTAHRTVQPALLLARAVVDSLQDGPRLIYALPNPHAIGVFLRLGYRKVARMNRYVKVLRSRSFLQRARRPRAVTAFSPLLDAGLRLRSAEVRRYDRGVRVEEIAASDPRLDNLWMKTRDAHLLTGERTTQSLKWRYEMCPLQTHKILGFADKPDGELLGYTACYQRADGQLRLPDLFLPPSRSEGRRVLAALVRWARRAGCNSIAIEVANPQEWLRDVLLEFGFSARGESDQLVALGPVARAGEVNNVDFSRWQFLRGEENYNTF